MSYHGIQFFGIAAIVYGVGTQLIGGALVDIGRLAAGGGLPAVFLGAVLDPIFEKRFAAALR